MSKINLDNYEAILLDYFEGNLNEAAIAELKAFAVLHPELNIELDNTELPYFSKEEVTIDFKKNLLKSEESLPDERLIAYVEGKLVGKEKEKFERELEVDQQLATGVKLYSKTIITADNTILASKNELLKTEEDLVLNNMSLLYIEGLLEGKEKIEFEGKVQVDTTTRSELTAYQKTKLVVDASIVHPDKESLKKEAKLVALFNTRTVIAVAAAILLLIGLVVIFNIYTTEPQYKKQTAVKDIEKGTTKTNIQENEKVKKENTNDNVNNTKEFESKISVVENPIAQQNKKENNNQFKDTATTNKQKEEPKLLVNDNKKPEQEVIPQVIKRDTTTLAKNDPPKTSLTDSLIFTKQTLLAFEEDDEEQIPSEETKRPGLWKRAVKAAQNMNGLGVKAVNGSEKPNDSYMISFNSFSIEKK